jgi:hypothetical protein
MKYVRQYGSIWQLSEQKFKELLEAGARGKSYNLNDYGVMVISGDDVIEPIDWRHADFKWKLDEYLQNRKKRKNKGSAAASLNHVHGSDS